jgi:hypothetical protein
MAGRATTNSFWKGHNGGAPAMLTIYRSAGGICRKIAITLKKVNYFFNIKSPVYIWTSLSVLFDDALDIVLCTMLKMLM